MSADRIAFMRALTDIIGQALADSYAKKIGDLDRPVGPVLGYEAVAFYTYTTGQGWHELINSALWSGSPSDAIVVFKDVLNRALAKLVPYRDNDGLVYRGYRAKDVRQFSQGYKVGTTVIIPAFTSAATDEESAFGGNVLFNIRSLNARAIWFLAADFFREEVLIPAGRPFLVVSNTVDHEKCFIVLEEVA